jgi:histone H3/H4
MQSVLPDGSIKSLFRELSLERSDDIVIASMQAELVSACLTPLLKSMIVSCMLHKRKYINERDIEYARRVSTLPCSSRKSVEKGYLLETRKFGKVCTSHIDIIIDVMSKQNMDPTSIKVSSEMLVHIQEIVEAHIRGCCEFFAAETGQRSYSYRLFDHHLAQLMGEPLDGRDDITFACPS